MDKLPQIELEPLIIHAVTLSEAVDYALSQPQCFAVTPNAVMLDACRRNPALAELLSHADLSLADGAGLLLQARRRGTPLPCRVAGIDFGEALLEKAAQERLRVFLLGGREGVADRAAANLTARCRTLCIAGTHWGYFDASEDKRLTAHIRATNPDLLFVCLGFPRQEQWIDAHLSALPSLRVAVGLGGALDVWAGDAHRAPRAVSRMGLEWAWRMALEPKRLQNLPAVLRGALKR